MAYNGHYSPKRVYFPSRETLEDFDFSNSANTAGLFDLSTEGLLVKGSVSRGETLLWTTTDLWTARFEGGEFEYAFERAGRDCGLISKRGFVTLDTIAFWMGAQKKFFLYDGYVKPLGCEVADKVFGDFNDALASKVWAFHNPRFHEVTWFYPSSAATTANPTDRYVTYNYVEDHWTYGAMSRAAGVTMFPGSATQTPVLIGPDGTIYDHETGNANRSGVFLESGPMKIGEGDNVLLVSQVVPDDKTLGDVNATLYAAFEQDDAEISQGPLTLASNTPVRLSGRQFRLRLAEAAAAAWRVGIVQLAGMLMGRR